ncbi:MAG: hypothetical protein HQ567_11020 [Candidatus Nealsonbacteria bacterium]|nr:hypothetical protein [Candidatus Nealsonbacteria bacterium]
MSKPSEKKRKKQKKRKKVKDRRKLALDRQREYTEAFPQFVFNVINSPPEFVECIQRAIKSIDFRDTKLFSPEEAEVLKFGKLHGLGVMLRVGDVLVPAAVYLAFRLGDIILSLIPQKELIRWFPFHDVQLLPTDRSIQVILRSLCQRPGRHGTIYYSRHCPTLDIDGQRKVVGFSRHAIEKTCKRIVPTWQTYGGLGDAFALFEQCIYFERCDLHDGQLAFTFFDQCAKGFFSEQYVHEVLGGWDKDEGHYYYRVGYCPAEIVDDFVVAKTLLFPGYTNTPEFRTVLQSRLPDWRKQNLIVRVQGLDVSEIRETGDFSLIKGFHDDGVPQVIHSDRPFFRRPF